MSEGAIAALSLVIMIPLLVVGGFFMKKEMDKRKRMSNITSIISVSGLTALSEIANAAGLSVTETKSLIAKMIELANAKVPEYKVLKNAHLDHAKNSVVLDAHANDSIMNKIGNSVNSALDRFAPKKEIKKDWTCKFCGALNKAKDYSCASCGAGRSGE